VPNYKKDFRIGSLFSFLPEAFASSISMIQ